MCNLYSITTNQEAIIRLFRVINRYVGNLAPDAGRLPGLSGSGGPSALGRALLPLEQRHDHQCRNYDRWPAANQNA
jgi:hypothetical protein